MKLWKCGVDQLNGPQKRDMPTTRHCEPSLGGSTARIRKKIRRDGCPQFTGRYPLCAQRPTLPSQKRSRKRTREPASSWSSPPNLVCVLVKSPPSTPPISWTQATVGQHSRLRARAGKSGRCQSLPALTHQIRRQEGPNGWVFPGNVNGHLSPRWVGTLATRVLPEPWTLHTLRHRFATVAYNAGTKDLVAVQHALGHKSITTTQRYTQTSLDLKDLMTTTKL